MNYALPVVLAAITVVIIFIIAGNNGITVSNYDIAIARLPAGFVGYKIVQISDIHNKSFGRRQQQLVAKIEEISPDICVVTGDYVVRNKGVPERSLALFGTLTAKWPVYLVTGNHEGNHKRWEEVRKLTIDTGIVLLEGTTLLKKGNDYVTLTGTDDPAFTNSCDNPMQSRFRDKLESTTSKIPNGAVRILLSHRPEIFDLYVELGYHLVFAGHAHGGLWRLPFIGPLVAPDQGLFPQYTSGVYSKNGTKMVVSRGLGPTKVPIRILNQPEIVVVRLL